LFKTIEEEFIGYRWSEEKKLKKITEIEKNNTRKSLLDTGGVKKRN